MPGQTVTFLQVTNQPSQVTELQARDLERFVMKTTDVKQDWRREWILERNIFTTKDQEHAETSSS